MRALAGWLALSTSAALMRMKGGHLAHGVTDDGVQLDRAAMAAASRSEHSWWVAPARELVERFGGTLKAENRPEGGARLRLELPVHSSPVPPER